MPVALTTEEFIKRARAVHGDRYRYARAVYAGHRVKLTITCPVHGDFETTPAAHLLKARGCRPCSFAERSRALSHSTAQFVENARLVHGDAYDYSRSHYVNAHTKLVVTCQRHGDFEITPTHHLHKQTGCVECSRAGATRQHQVRRSRAREEFLKRARAVHGDAYDYSKVVYVNASTKVTITCHLHGDFAKSPASHTGARAQGCPRCAYIAAGISSTWTTEQFIDRAREVHGPTYDYAGTEYLGANKEVTIRCPIHGDFVKRAAEHIHRRRGCPQCARARSGTALMISTEEFIERALAVHGDRYDYSEADYRGATVPVVVICRQHGSFSTSPTRHINTASGCPACGQSTVRAPFESPWRKRASSSLRSSGTPHCGISSRFASTSPSLHLGP